MTTDLIGKRLGEFEVVRELGRGGMGVVYEAVQTSLGRRVALKVLGTGFGLTPLAVDRFRREAAAAARLHHTNIVPVYATGEQDGTHFYAMELIHGQALDAVIRQLREQKAAGTPPAVPPDLTTTNAYTPPDPLTASGGSGGSSADRFDRIAVIVADVADALHHAHQHGVTHRDVKPSNLMLSADGRPSVTDFGLARLLEQPGMTVTGEFVGTPAYMSPEQITTGRIPVDHRTDIYSLGATLYELLTLRPPFVADGRDKLLAMVIQKEPPSPRAVDPKVPRDLETICLKCLEKDPDRRYQSAKELADDLRRYVSRFAILARRTGPLTKLRKWVRRNPTPSAAGVAVVLALATAGFFAWRSHEAEQRRVADERKREEEFTAERRRAAVERGMTAALAADLPAAEKAVADAEALGASAGEIWLLRGFIATYGEQGIGALAHLEQAVRLMPESVSARALLVAALADANEWPRAMRTLDEAAALTPRTPEDKIFLGQAVGIFRPADGLKLMDEALAERSFGIGHVIRSILRVALANKLRTVEATEDAVADAVFADRFLNSSPASLTILFYAHLYAADAHRRAGRADRQDEHLAQASRVADRLARFPKHSDAVTARAYLAAIKDGLDGRDDLLAELRVGRAANPGPNLAYLEALNLLTLGRDEEAAKVADEFPDVVLNGYVRFLLALGRTDGRGDACRALARISGPEVHPIFRLGAAQMLTAVGTKQEVAELCRDLQGVKFDLGQDLWGTTEVTVARLRFVEGKMSETELLALSSQNHLDRDRLISAVAWKRLGNGDREGAKAAFRQVYDMMGFTVPWDISRAVLIRMKDPAWPQAITMKK